MTGPLLLGAGFGLGLTALAAWVVPARPSLAAAVAALHPAPSDTTTGPLTLPGDHTPGWLARLGRAGTTQAARAVRPRPNPAPGCSGPVTATASGRGRCGPGG